MHAERTPCYGHQVLQQIMWQSVTAAVREMTVRTDDLVPIAGFTVCAKRAVNHTVRTYDLVPIAGFTVCAKRQSIIL
jgi:hypothetical protein